MNNNLVFYNCNFSSSFVVVVVVVNYADDNTVSFIHKDLHILKIVLEQDNLNFIKLFEKNIYFSTQTRRHLKRPMILMCQIKRSAFDRP